MEDVKQALLECGVATRTLGGQSTSGDRCVIKPFPEGVLVAVVDGLGHGEEAAEAAVIAAFTLEHHADEPVLQLIKRCHEKLRGTRGAVISVASFHARAATMTWLGAGNVEGLLLRAENKTIPPYQSLLLRGGVVGHRLPPLLASIVPIMPRDTLIFVTDGITSGFSQGLMLSDLPQKIADRILGLHGKETDDALVVVARYLGCSP